MKTTKYLILSAVLCLSAFGQTATTSTTFSSAVTDKNVQVVNLTSATNVSVGGYLFADGEVMTVKSTYVSGTAIPVNRGGPGTRAVPHLNAATVYVFAPGDQARTGLINYELYGACTRSEHTTLPRINMITGHKFDCFGGYWYNVDTFSSLYSLTLAPGAQPSAASPTAGTAIAITGQAGGAQLATTSGGAAGAAITETGGVGGVGGTSSGTGGAGGAVGLIGGAGGGTVTGGAGGVATLKGGAGANGSGAGGSGGDAVLQGGNVGTGGTGVVGLVKVKGSADPTKVVVIDPAGNTTAITETLAFGATSARTATFPDATGTLSMATVIACGTTSTCSATNKSAVAIIHQGTVALTSASPSTVTVTGFSPAYTSTSTFSCTATPTGATAALAAAGVAVTLTSSSSVTFTSQNTTATVINYICVGY